MEIGRKNYIKYAFSNGKCIYLSEEEEKELEDHYEDILTPIIREQAKKDLCTTNATYSIICSSRFL